MNASNLLVTISAANLVAMVILVLRIGERIGKAETTQTNHGRRLDAVEPKVDKLAVDVGVLRGRCLGRRDYDPKLQQQ